MHRIDPNSYDRAHPIFAELSEIHLHIIAILNGDSAGEVYVDDVGQPQTAYIRAGDGHYLAGVPDNHSFNVAVNAALPRDTYFVLFCNPEQWQDALDVVLKDTYALRAARRYYTLQQLKMADWRDRIPEGFSMHPVDAKLLAKGLKNTDSVLDWIDEEWMSVDAYLEQGFGFCLVHDAEIVSWSLADYVSGNRCEIGITTAWEHRRQGLGTLAAAANAAQTVAQGFTTIGWHCWDNNVGSIGVAEKVGFQKAADYDVFINHWVAENITDMTQDEFRTFAERYEGMFEAQPPTSGFPHIVAAKAWALGRDREGCFRHLHKAVDLGWLRGVEHLRQIWPEFFWNPNLDEMEEWHTFVERFTEKTGVQQNNSIPNRIPPSGN
jgi:RimJ/RimL family protein N-acetyltransferase